VADGVGESTATGHRVLHAVHHEHADDETLAVLQDFLAVFGSNGLRSSPSVCSFI
jgi:hypothetical protein